MRHRAAGWFWGHSGLIHHRASSLGVRGATPATCRDPRSLLLRPQPAHCCFFQKTLMTNFLSWAFSDHPNKLERSEPSEPQRGKREAWERESCLSPASLGTVGQGQHCSSRGCAGRVWALPADGRTPLLLVPKLGLALERGTVCGTGSWHLCSPPDRAVSEPMPISCMWRVDGILSWGMGS